MHERILIDIEINHRDHEVSLVYLGDYIDGGPMSRQVIDRLMRGLPDMEMVHLKGNHEAMMLACLESDERDVWQTWLSNGGYSTAESFGVSFRFGGYEPNILIDALGSERINWCKKLKLYHKIDNYLFVHAGIVPGIPIEQQQEKDLLWIRSRFLEFNGDHGCRIVHGHTPRDVPDVQPNRIGIDTGATSNGVLTAVVIQQSAEPRFLSVLG